MSSVLVIVTFIISMILVAVNINKFMHIFQQSFYQLDDFLPAIKTTKVYKIQIYLKIPCQPLMNVSMFP